MNLALTVLLTGIVVVFTVLITLTFIIKFYGLVITKLQKNKKHLSIEFKDPSSHLEHQVNDERFGYINDDILAVICASVASMYPDSAKYKIKNVKQVFNTRPAWGLASIIENTKPF